MRGLSFRIGGSRLALPLREIAQVLALPLLRPLAGAAPEVAGLLNLHGESVAVIDLTLACSGRSEPPGLRSRIALLPAREGEGAEGARTLGLLLHETGAIVEAPAPLAPCPVATGSLPIFAGLSLQAGASAGFDASLLWLDVPALRTWIDKRCHLVPAAMFVIRPESAHV